MDGADRAGIHTHGGTRHGADGFDSGRNFAGRGDAGHEGRDWRGRARRVCGHRGGERRSAEGWRNPGTRALRHARWRGVQERTHEIASASPSTLEASKTAALPERRVRSTYLFIYTAYQRSIAVDGSLRGDRGVRSFRCAGEEMKKSVKVLAVFALLLMPAVGNAQKLGQIACSKQDGYVDLYSSIATLEIRASLKCGQQVQILDRSDNFVHVRTDSGEDGFVAANSVLFVKTVPAAKSAATHSK